MIDFTRQPAEPPAAWLERLLRAGMGDLTNDQRIDLAHHIQAAQQAAGWVPQTPSVRPPEALADSLIAVAPTTPGGPLFVQLKGTAETVLIGPYANPGIAHTDAVKIRAFLAEVIAEARREGAARLDAARD